MNVHKTAQLINELAKAEVREQPLRPVSRHLAGDIVSDQVGDIDGLKTAEGVVDRAAARLQLQRLLAKLGLHKEVLPDRNATASNLEHLLRDVKKRLDKLDELLPSGQISYTRQFAESVSRAIARAEQEGGWPTRGAIESHVKECLAEAYRGGQYEVAEKASLAVGLSLGPDEEMAARRAGALGIMEASKRYNTFLQHGDRLKRDVDDGVITQDELTAGAIDGYLQLVSAGGDHPNVVEAFERWLHLDRVPAEALQAARQKAAATKLGADKSALASGPRLVPEIDRIMQNLQAAVDAGELEPSALEELVHQGIVAQYNELVMNPGFGAKPEAHEHLKSFAKQPVPKEQLDAIDRQYVESIVDKLVLGDQWAAENLQKLEAAAAQGIASPADVDRGILGYLVQTRHRDPTFGFIDQQKALWAKVKADRPDLEAKVPAEKPAIYKGQDLKAIMRQPTFLPFQAPILNRLRDMYLAALPPVSREPLQLDLASRIVNLERYGQAVPPDVKALPHDELTFYCNVLKTALEDALRAKGLL